MKNIKHEKADGVKSPCIKKCELDRQKVCVSCFRHIDEIMSWNDADDAERQKVLEAARHRRERASDPRS